MRPSRRIRRRGLSTGAGHQVLVIDILPPPSTGCRPPSAARPIRGDGTDEDVLRRAGAEGADVFLALTEGDNRNVMAAQLAAEALGIERVDRQDQRPGPGQGLRRARHRHAVPDRADGRRRRSLSRPTAGTCPGCSPRPATTAAPRRTHDPVAATQPARDRHQRDPAVAISQEV